jgi:predicted Zn-dependent peptidase
MRKIRPAWWLALALLLCASSSALQAQMKSKMAAKGGVKAAASGLPPIVYKETKLKNGLRVLLVEDHDAPVVSFALIYDVGSRNEKVGRTGFAHLFEHMMFQGSENIGKSEHFILIDNNGGFMNGTTNEERTLYFETLPANQLDLGLYMEADRMRSLDISTENLDNQRKAVQEERRLRVDNQAYGALFERFGETQWDNPNYKHSVIGSMEDLNAASVADVSEFFRMYYAPNNAVLTVVGDFDPKVALAKVKKYFESIPAQPAPPPVDAAEPAQTAERRFTVEDGLAQLPLMLISYKTTSGNQPDIYALQMLGGILGGGQSSRLYQALVKEKQLALFVASQGDNRRGPNNFSLNASVAPGKKAEDLEAAIYAEIERLQKEGVTDAELDKAKAGRRRQAIQSRQSSLGRAIALTEAAVAWKDPNHVNTSLDRYMAVTKADIQRVAQQYLKAANRTVGIAVPKPKTAAKPGE